MFSHVSFFPYTRVYIFKTWRESKDFASYWGGELFTKTIEGYMVGV